MKKISKARSRYDLELGKIFPTLPITQIRSGCLGQAGSKSLPGKAEAEVNLFLNSGTFLSLPPGGRWRSKTNDPGTSQSSPAYNIISWLKNPQLNRPALHEITLKKFVCNLFPFVKWNLFRSCLEGGRCSGWSRVGSVFVQVTGLCKFFPRIYHVLLP